MTRTNYNRGRETERRILSFFRDREYDITLRSAGSKGSIDTVVANDDITRFIQVKRSKGVASYSQELKSLSLVSCPPEATVELWHWRDNVGFDVVYIIHSRTRYDLEIPEGAKVLVYE